MNLTEIQVVCTQLRRLFQQKKYKPFKEQYTQLKEILETRYTNINIGFDKEENLVFFRSSYDRTINYFHYENIETKEELDEGQLDYFNEEEFF